ncbi:unnamed protein product [Rhizoctonia solani]|uniref:RRM domain-containing protein n=1 Tax=Rhizoctonia solani TaxID=456999 RepID=A0A8H2WEC2_9AGAM|nr:unnamed protein product [Rhizoctonia solani]
MPELKLTKKQRKGIAFRERRGKAGPSRDGADEPADIPELEVQDEQIKLSDEQTPKQPEVTVGKKRKRVPEDGQVNEDPRNADGVSPKVKSKKRKTTKAADDSNENDVSKGDAKLKRFILFVGNLPYTISKAQILEHFSECSPAPAIRLLTSKSRTGKPQTAVQAAKNKGCAFLEFSSHEAGGGGNSDQRKEKLRVRNRTLNDQRKRGAERRSPKGSGLDGPEQSQSRLPTRHSTTSGETQVVDRPKTWSIPTTQDHQVQRRKTRGKSADKGAKAVHGKPSWAPSGANAIKVG